MQSPNKKLLQISTYIFLLVLTSLSHHHFRLTQSLDIKGIRIKITYCESTYICPTLSAIPWQSFLLFCTKSCPLSFDLLYNSKWAPVLIFYFFYVSSFSSPKSATRFAKFRTKQNVTLSQKGSFALRTDMLSAFHFAKKWEIMRSVHFAKTRNNKVGTII